VQLRRQQVWEDEHGGVPEAATCVAPFQQNHEAPEDHLQVQEAAQVSYQVIGLNELMVFEALPSQ
jgi:hypothetical protein